MNKQESRTNKTPEVLTNNEVENLLQVLGLIIMDKGYWGFDVQEALESSVKTIDKLLSSSSEDKADNTVTDDGVMENFLENFQALIVKKCGSRGTLFTETFLNQNYEYKSDILNSIRGLLLYKLFIYKLKPPLIPGSWM